MPTRVLFDSLRRLAGALSTTKDGRPMIATFGSPAGELAACVSHVGIADRSDLRLIELLGEPELIDQLAEHVLQCAPPVPGGVVPTGSLWWCAAAPGRAILVIEAGDGSGLADSVSETCATVQGLAILDRSGSWAAIGLLGRELHGLLAAIGALGPHGDPMLTAPFGPARAGGEPGLLLLQSNRRALFLVEQELAPAVWWAVSAAGRAFGLCTVGSEAVSRFELLDRRPA